jgi:hypothetical protein
MLAFRSVVSVLVSFVRSFSTNSRPALRAASGRPPARQRHTVTGEPASPCGPVAYRRLQGEPQSYSTTPKMPLPRPMPAITLTGHTAIARVMEPRRPAVSAETILMVLVVLVCFGWIPVVVIAVARGRRPRTGYGRQLRAAERGGHRRRGDAASAHLASPSGSTRGPLAWTSVNPDQTP